MRTNRIADTYDPNIALYFTNPLNVKKDRDPFQNKNALDYLKIDINFPYLNNRIFKNHEQQQCRE